VVALQCGFLAALEALHSVWWSMDLLCAVLKQGRVVAYAASKNAPGRCGGVKVNGGKQGSQRSSCCAGWKKRHVCPHHRYLEDVLEAKEEAALHTHGLWFTRVRHVGNNSQRSCDNAIR